ncbi:MAG: exodeoxyribonuclease VII large subunit [Sedimentisphaerales bacterium]|nr:exodeoxyribonuclease VII large subunit [Sedimentisphaerales bacterium]
MQKNNHKIYTVSQVNLLIKAALEENLPSRLIVKGEIRDFKRHSSGHCYFSLKDESGILPCVMWSSKFKNVKFLPEDGMAVLATGFIDVYTTGGKYQFYVDKLEPAGVGALQLAFEQMVKKLRAEGLFDDEHKKAIPKFPQSIGIVTSETGAAVHDIVDSIYSRWPCVKLFLYPVPVQGEGAAEKISAVLKDINKRNRQLKLDVLIVGRGGGSLEDLWAFNEEVLARAIFASNIPVISAVGHEVDTTIADLVADARASTPTKAGVVAVPDMWDILEQLNNYESRLSGRTQAAVQLAAHNLRTILADSMFRNPLLIVRAAEQQLDEINSQLSGSMKTMMAVAGRRLSESYEQVVKIEPHRLLGKKMLDLNNMLTRANTGVNGIVNNLRMQLTAAANRLEGLNPRSVLERGYSITTNKKTGLLIRAVEDIQVGDYMTTELAGENLIESKVTKR